MNNKYAGKVPAVIDEQMIVESLEDSHKYKHAEQDSLDDVTSLNLAYKNILKISNIWYLRNLTKLQLNNNLIEKVEGLKELTNLVWLDLSFNNIEKIEGMESLTKLKDLSLFNNNIGKLENMDALIDLQLLSVGNNNIKDFSNVIYLRRFKALNSLTLEGNPLSTTENYRSYTIALLSSLVYLDYSVIDENMKENTRRMYEMDIEKLEEADIEANALQRSSKENFFALEKDAFIDKVKGSFIVEIMFANDEEGKLLSNIPSNKTASDEYFKSLNSCCEQLYQYGMKVYEERQNEISEFEKFLTETKQRNKEQATIEINKFTSSQSCALHNLLLNSNAKDELDGEKLEDLKMVLLLLEVQLVDQIEESIKEFSQNLIEINNDFIDQVRFRLQECRRLESIYYHKILSESATISDEVFANKMDDEFFAGNLANILMDKDSLQSSAKSSHELHIQILENLEDEIARNSNAWMENYLKNIQKDEILRNRNRTLEIIHLIDSLQEEDFHVAQP